MNKQTSLAGFLLIMAAISFWVSWVLMPDPGTTDTIHILTIVRQSRMSVFYSVIIQIVSSVSYMAALFLLAQISFPQKKATLIGITLLGVGVLGLCSDAFFHLLAYFMTDDSVTIQKDVVSVMNFMQTKGVRFLIPLLLSFFIGSLVLASGLNKQKLISKKPVVVFYTVFIIGLAVAIIVHTTLAYKGPLLTLPVLGLFAIGQALMGKELISASRKKKRRPDYNRLQAAYVCNDPDEIQVN